MAAIFREGTNPVWGAIMAICVLGCIGLDFYWLFTDSGLIRWLAVKEAAILKGKWFPKLTVILVILAQMGIILFLKLSLEKILGKKLTKSIDKTDT